MQRALMAAFALGGDGIRVERWGRGRIHASYRVEAGGGAYLLQAVNTHVFRDVEALADNIRRVTGHLRAALDSRGVVDSSRRVLEIVPSASGASLWRAPDGSCWRAFRFIADAVAPPVPATARQIFEAARCFGRFLRDMDDLPAPPLAVTIPAFHDTSLRYRDFEAAVAEDPHGRAAAAQPLVAALRARASLAGAFDELAAGSLPMRVVHNDCKLDNVLFDVRAGGALCVVDLDTVMPGCMLYDVGDLVRSASCLAAEDDAVAPVFSPDRYATVLRGYLAGAGDLLCREELAGLAVAGRVVTYELALRFLTDHLLGDGYFAVSSPMQNRRRAARQLQLLSSMEARAGEMDALARRIVASRP
jgi:hypothetical protein